MSKYWSKVVHELTPYVPGEQPKLANLIKLNTNENPYGPSPKVLEALRAEAADSLRLYPDPNSDKLKAAIAEFHGLNQSQVFVGNGSDEVLAHTFLALLKHDAPLLFPDITYSFYPVYCGLYGIEYQTVALNDTFEIRVDDYFKTGNFKTNGGIIFPNPNAPTGCLLALSEIKRLLQVNTESVVVIDEAYIDFGGQSAVGLVNRFPQLLVTHSLSKGRSLAGLRVGYAVGHADLIDALHRVKDSFNSYPLDRFAQAGAIAAMQDRRGNGQREAEQCAAERKRRGAVALHDQRHFVIHCHARINDEKNDQQQRTRQQVYRIIDEREIREKAHGNPPVGAFYVIRYQTSMSCLHD